MPTDSVAFPPFQCNRPEAGAFKDALGPDLFRQATIVRLYAIRPDGSCSCADAPWLRDDQRCRNATTGKHPFAWREEYLPDGSKPRDVHEGRGGLGLATGLRSGGIVVIDLDLKPGKNGFESLERAEREIGPLPQDVLTVDTPTGGVHLYFTCPTPIRSASNVLGPALPGVDSRGEDGYVVIPGSPHRCGGVYTVRHPVHPPQPLPPAWAARLRASATGATYAAPPDTIEVPPHDLRAQLRDTLRGKRGPVWDAWRAIERGERFFDFANPPGTVDEWIVKKLFAALAVEPGWLEPSGASIAAMADTAFSHLRGDAESLGTPSKWDAGHLGRKWDARRPWAAGVLAQRERDAAIAAELIAASDASRADRARRAAVALGGAR